MKTILTHYCYNLDKKDDRERWEALKKRLTPTHNKHCSHSGYPQPVTNKNETETVTLDKKYLFSNQWNEAGEGGRRLFDWYLEYRLNGDGIRQGHYLELTEEMVKARDENVKCGYCGYMEPLKNGNAFCRRCLGNEYLKESELHWLRLKPISWVSWGNRGGREKLTDKERAELLPLYREAQGLGKVTRETQRMSKNRRKVAAIIPDAEKKAGALIDAAKVETEAYTWLLDRGLNILDNVIYYEHKKTFCFGWINPYKGEERQGILDALRNFPWDYELK